jgi:D-alanyl-D-alanine carboxypeptidase
LRRSSYPTSGYSLGTRGRRSSRRVLAPSRKKNRKKNPYIRPIILVIALFLGSRVYGMLTAHHEMQPVAATARTPTPRATTRPQLKAAPTARPTVLPSATPTPSPTITAPAQLPQVNVPVFSTSWMRRHPIAQPPAINAHAAIVIDLGSGEILYEKDATSRYPEASLTKMMTAMVAVDLAPLDTVITVPQAATQVEPNHMGIQTGEQLTLQQLLEGMLLDSGNDAAEAIAMGMVDRGTFIALMNQKVAQLHLRETHFANPTGLDDANHYSSAYDLAVISATLLQDYPALRTIVGTRSLVIEATPQHGYFNPINIDRLLWSYPGAIGIKPGYTGAANYCLAAAASRSGRTILAVVLDSTQHFTDATTLLNFGFAQSVSR